MRKEILALAAGAILFTGCAQKEIQSSAIAQPEGKILLEMRTDRQLDRTLLKNIIIEAAKEEGWLTTTLGEREVIVEKYFSETKNIAAEVLLRENGYDIEYSSGQNISEHKIRSLLEDLKEAIDEKLEKIGLAKH